MKQTDATASGGSLMHRLAVIVLRAALGTALQTSRWRVSGVVAAREVLTGAPTITAKGAVVAFWHQGLPVMPALWSWARRRNPGLRLRVLISRNRDGRLISDVVAPWGILGIAGSTARRGKDKGGARALRMAVKALADGELVAITPDGPRGPVFKAEAGVLALARIGRRPIVPVGTATSGLQLRSWDGMRLPRPFGRGEIVCGAPLPPDCTLEELECALNTVHNEAQRLQAMRPVMRDHLWAVVGRVLAPGLVVLLQRRVTRGRDLADRRRERMGFAGLKRPEGRVLWLHAASVGEAISLRPLLDALVKSAPGRTLLVTTATVTGAEIVNRHAQVHSLPVVHQFIPFDVMRWVGRFLDHWRPEAAVIVESEIWPGLLGACRARDVPVSIVNGRMSDRSWRRWQRLGRVSASLFGEFAWIAARGAEDAARFAALGARCVVEYGDLKHEAPPLEADHAALASITSILEGRPVLLCASTHSGEEVALAPVLARLRQTFPRLLSIIVPRHPHRGAEIAALYDQAPQRSQGDEPRTDHPVWIADTLGELGLFYRLCPVVFMGNSLEATAHGGGHNPFEPARLGAAIVSGLRIQNFRAAFEALGESAIVTTDEQLHDVLARLLADRAAVQHMGQTALARAQAASGVVARLVSQIDRGMQ